MKKIIHCISGLLLIIIFTRVNKATKILTLTNLTTMTNMTLLALGDSYTIGESVLLTESFPYQTVQLMRKDGYNFSPPEMIAKTGWTTDELQTAINNHDFLASYDFVTLLIGVNDQYRGRSVENYKPQFEKLLNDAIALAGGRPAHVIVLSIPDWGATPFASGRDRNQIAKEIDAFNSANKNISDRHNVIYIDITPGTREAMNDPSLVAEDGLHPSAKVYNRWAKKLTGKIKDLTR